MNKEFIDFLEKLNCAVTNRDVEVAHGSADCILKEIALSTTLTLKERKQLVKVYDLVEKWYA